MQNLESTRKTGMYWEEFNVEQVFTSASRQITETDVLTFAKLTGDFNPLHLDEAFAETTPFGRRIAHGLLGLSIASGLGEQEGILTGTIVAFIGMEWKLNAPIFLGDTIFQKRIVMDKTETSDPSRGIIKFRVEVINQDRKVVQEGIRTILVKRKKT